MCICPKLNTESLDWASGYIVRMDKNQREMQVIDGTGWHLQLIKKHTGKANFTCQQPPCECVDNHTSQYIHEILAVVAFRKLIALPDRCNDVSLMHFFPHFFM